MTENPSGTTGVELAARREALIAESKEFSERSTKLCIEIEVVVWAQEGKDDVDAIFDAASGYCEIETRYEAVKDLIAEQRHDRPRLLALGAVARQLLIQNHEIQNAEEEKQNLLHQEQECLARQIEQKTAALTAQRNLEIARLADSLRARLSALSGSQFTIQLPDSALEQRLRRLSEELESAKRLLDQTNSVGAIKRQLMGLPEPESQSLEVGRLESEHEELLEGFENSKRILGESMAKQKEIYDLNKQLEGLQSDIGVSHAEERLASSENKLRQIAAKLEGIRAGLQHLVEAETALAAEFESFEEKHGHSPADVVELVEELEVRLKSLEQEHDRLHERLFAEQSILEPNLRKHIEALEFWRLCDGSFGSVSTMLDTIESAHKRAVENSAGTDLKALREAKRSADERILQINLEIEAFPK